MSMDLTITKGQGTGPEDEELPSEDTKPPDMPWFVPNDEEQSVYRFILVASRRARQLQGGARPTISTTSRKPTKIAMDEIRLGEVEVDLNPRAEPKSTGEEAADEETSTA
jgi:DNA-directed RNA polymerase subunit omega